MDPSPGHADLRGAARLSALRNPPEVCIPVLQNLGDAEGAVKGHFLGMRSQCNRMCG